MTYQLDLPDHVQAHRTFLRAWQQLPESEQKAVHTTIVRLHEHPKYPSLHVHAVKRAPGIQECYVSQSLRLLYRREQATLYLLNVGSHHIIQRAHQCRSG